MVGVHLIYCTVQSQDDLKKRINIRKILDSMDDLDKWINGFVLYEPADNRFLQIIHFVKYFFFSSFSSTHPDVKCLVRHSIPSPNQQRQPFHSLMLNSYSMELRVSNGKCH